MDGKGWWWKLIMGRTAWAGCIFVVHARTSAIGTTAPTATALEVARPSNIAEHADAEVLATVWPRGPSRRSEGPVRRVPTMVEDPTRAA
jgi:hypothetical protein